MALKVILLRDWFVLIILTIASESPMKMLPNNNDRDASSSFRRDITPGSKPSFEINTFKSPNEKQSNNNDVSSVRIFLKF